MTTSYFNNETLLKGESETLYEDQIQQTLKAAVARFDGMTRSSALVHFLFCGALIGEVISLIVLMTFLIQSSLLALALAILFFTFFSYLIYRVYEQTSKPEKLQDMLELILDSCKTLIHYQENVPEHLMRLANVCCRLSDQLEGKDYAYYRPFKRLSFLVPFFEKISLWLHGQDVYRIREVLLQAAIHEHLKMVRYEPTNLNVHAHLANAYVMLSGIYLPLLKKQSAEPKLYFREQDRLFEEKFRKTAQKAIEEFKILLDYAPHDPWVHMQLAYSYHDLKMPLEEIKEYETILQINPNDHEVLYKLGTLYFQEGMNAKGLRIYEALRHHHYKKAESLISLYGGPLTEASALL